MSYINPTIDQFKTRFARDFPFGTQATQVNDNDIANAFIATNSTLNADVPDQAFYTQAYNLLSAHNLVLDLRASSLGMAGSFSWLEQSKAVGNVSQSFAIPQSILNNPIYAALMSTSYGSRYLLMMLPYLVAPIWTICGTTLP